MAAAGSCERPWEPNVWHRRAKHCPLCGAVLRPDEVAGRLRPRCTSCSFVLFTNPACAAAGVVVSARGEILLVRRALEPFRGSWALPAGYQEMDEEPTTTVAREIREEAGLEVRVEGLLDLLHVEDPRKPANVAVFLCSVVAGTPRPGDEETDARFFPLHDLPKDIGFDNYERILRRLDGSQGYPDAAWQTLSRMLGRSAR